MTILYRNNMDSAHLLVKEEDVIKLILEFLSAEHYHVTLRALEKESNVYNCDYSDELLFLRELVLDGDFTEVLDFAKSFSSNPAFNLKFFNYLVLRQKFIELIYKKLHLGNVSKGEDDEDVDDVMKTLRSLESCCPSREEYNNLCWLLTVPNLQACEGFTNWKVDMSRLKCFDDLLNCLSDIMPTIRKNKGNAKVSKNNRLLQLIVKGLFYESCVDYCQSVVLSVAMEKKPVFSIKNQLLDNANEGFPSNLLSWVASLPHDVFNLPFEHTDVSISLSNIQEKPSVLFTSDISTSYDQLKFSNNSKLTPSLNEGKQKTNILEKVIATKKNVENTHANNSLKKGEKNKTVKNNIKNTNVNNTTILPEVKATTFEKEAEPPLNDKRKLEHESHINKDFNKEVSTNAHHNKMEIKQKSKQNDSYDLISKDKVSPSKEQPLDTEYRIQQKIQNSEKDTVHALSTPDVINSITKSTTCNIGHSHTSAPSSTQAVNSNMKKDDSHQEMINVENDSSKKTYVEKVDELSIQSLQHKVDKQEVELLSNDKNELLESQEKENKHDSKEVILGPLINGVRRPISSFVLNTNGSYGEQNEITRNTTKKNKSVVQDKKSVLHEKKSVQVANNSTDIPEKYAEVRKNSRNTVEQQVDENSYEDVNDSMKLQKSDNNIRQYDNNIRQRDTMWRYKPMSMIEDSQAVRSVAFTPNGNFFSIGANSKMLRICLMTQPEIDDASDMLPRMSVMFKRNKYHRGSIYSMAWDPHGEILATGSNDKSIKLLRFDATTFKQVDDETELNIHQGTVRELAFVPNKRGLLISGGAGDGCVHISDIVSQKSTGTLDGHSGNVFTVYAGNRDIVATGGTDNTLRLWDLRSQRCVDVVVVGESSPASVTLSGDDKYLASGQEDGSILLYDLVAGRTLQNFRLHQSDCRSVRFSPTDSTRLLTASYDNTLSILHVNSDLEMSIPNHYVIGKHHDKVIQARWHASQDYLLSSSADRTAVLWSRD